MTSLLNLSNNIPSYPNANLAENERIIFVPLYPIIIFPFIIISHHYFSPLKKNQMKPLSYSKVQAIRLQTPLPLLPQSSFILLIIPAMVYMYVPLQNSYVEA